MTTDKPTVWRRNFLIQILTTKQLIFKNLRKCQLSCHQCFPSSTNFLYSPRTCFVIITWCSAFFFRIHSEMSRNINKGYPRTLAEFTPQKKTCTSLTTSFISKYVLKFMCCQVWTESMAKGEETKFTQSTRVGSINRSHQQMSILAHKAPTSIYDILFFPIVGGSGWIPSQDFLVTLMGESNVSSLYPPYWWGGNLQVLYFISFFPLWNLLKVCCISSAQKFSITPPSKKKKLLSVAPWFQNSIDINKTLLFCSFYSLFCLGKVSKKKPMELPLSGHVFPSWRLEVPSLQRSLLRARYSKVLKVKNMPFRIHQTSAPKLPWSWSPNPPRSILWCSGTTSSTWSQKSMSKLSRKSCSDLCFGLFWLHVPGKCSQFVRTMLFQPLPRICEKLGRIKGGALFA